MRGGVPAHAGPAGPAGVAGAAGVAAGHGDLRGLPVPPDRHAVRWQAAARRDPFPPWPDRRQRPLSAALGSPRFHAEFDGISIDPLAWRQKLPRHNRLLQDFVERFLLGPSSGRRLRSPNRSAMCWATGPHRHDRRRPSRARWDSTPGPCSAGCMPKACSSSSCGTRRDGVGAPVAGPARSQAAAYRAIAGILGPIGAHARLPALVRRRPQALAPGAASSPVMAAMRNTARSNPRPRRPVSGERPDGTLRPAMTMFLAGIALGTPARRRYGEALEAPEAHGTPGAGGAYPGSPASAGRPAGTSPSAPGAEALRYSRGVTPTGGRKHAAAPRPNRSPPARRCP